MAKGVNGTIDPDFEQVVQQRDATRQRNLTYSGGKNFGVSFIDNAVSGILYPDTPKDMDVYEEFAKYVDHDKDAPVNGFGFEGSNTVDLNYQNEGNPFIVNDKLDYDALTKGTPAGSGSERRYLGFPDPKPSTDLDTPEGVPTDMPTAGIYISSDGTEDTKDKTQSFGTTTTEARDAQEDVYPNDNRGTYNTSGTNFDYNDSDEDSNTLGKYFKSNYLD
jgi:hypothetical protein